MADSFALAFQLFSLEDEGEHKFQLFKEALDLMQIEDAKFDLLVQLSEEYEKGLLLMKKKMFSIGYFTKDTPSFCDFFSFKIEETLDYWPFDIPCYFCSEVLATALEELTDYGPPASITYIAMKNVIVDLHEEHCVYASKDVVNDYAKRLLP